MIALAIPGLEDFLFRCAGNVTELERKRRNTLLNEAVLVAADETIVIRFLVGLYLYTRLSGNRAHAVAQSGFAEPLDLEGFQRKQRKVHIHINIGDDRAGHGGMRGEILGAQQSLFFASDRKKQNRALWFCP